MADITDIRKGKEEALKNSLDIENIDLSTLSDEELDNLFSNLTNMDEKVNSIFDCMESLDTADEEDIKEAIRLNIGVSIKEADFIYKQKIQERTQPQKGIEKLLQLM